MGGAARKNKSSKSSPTQKKGLFFLISNLKLMKSECSDKCQRQPIICKVLCSRKRRGDDKVSSDDKNAVKICLMLNSKQLERS